MCATNSPDDFEKRSGWSTTGLEQVSTAWGHMWPSACFCKSSVSGTQFVSVLSGITAETTVQAAELFAFCLASTGRFCQPSAVVTPAPMLAMVPSEPHLCLLVVSSWEMMSPLCSRLSSMKG